MTHAPKPEKQYDYGPIDDLNEAIERAEKALVAQFIFPASVVLEEDGPFLTELCFGKHGGIYRLYLRTYSRSAPILEDGERVGQDRRPLTSGAVTLRVAAAGKLQELLAALVQADEQHRDGIVGAANTFDAFVAKVADLAFEDEDGEE